MDTDTTAGAEPEQSRNNRVEAGSYSLSNTWDKARTRLQALEGSHNDLSQSWLNSYLKPGHACLEIGPGLGSMTRFMADAVGPSGRVTALDIEPHFLAEIPQGRSNIQTAHGDVADYPLEDACLDLIYMRLVLCHLTQIDHVALLKRLANTLRPGGYLIVEDYASSPHALRYAQFANRHPQLPAYMESLYRMMSGHIDFTMCYRLPGMLHEAGLQNIHSEIRSAWVQGQSPYGTKMKLTIEQLEPYLQQVDGFGELHPLLMALWDDPDYSWYDDAKLFVVAEKV